MLPYTFKPNLTKTQKKKQNASKIAEMTAESKDYPFESNSKAISRFQEDEDPKDEALRRSKYY